MREQSVEQLSDSNRKRLDLAARAAWLNYVRGRTQDEIAAELNVSRQNVQRLIALANSAGLIKFRLDHHLSNCVELAQSLRDSFGLRYAEVAPGLRPDDDNRASVAITAGRYIETLLTQKPPLVLGFGTGRSLRAAVRQVPSMEQPQHKIVSLVGNVGPDGRATPYDVVMRLSDKVGAQCYPLPMPTVTDTIEERTMIKAQRGYQAIRSFATEACTWIVGVGELGWNAPLHDDGFINDSELAMLMEKGAVGEILSWTFDEQGRFVHIDLHDRLTALRPDTPIPDHRTVIGVAAGPQKVPALLGTLRGRLINGLITDEATAKTLLECATTASESDSSCF